MELVDIKSMTLGEIEDDFKSFGIEPYRAKQVYKWIMEGAESFDAMTNISKSMRTNLSEKYFIPNVSIERKSISKDGTVKYLFKMFDGNLIESVLMKYKHGYSMCISTQVGCKMGCSFCVTGKSGFIRNLHASEMLLQIEKAQKDNNIRISNIVLMGMGEPLDNYENVLKFLELVSDPNGLGIGMRHISLSTCGIVDKIYDLAEKKLQLTLSISLHAPNDKLRNSMMKINKRWNVKDLINACKYYILKTNRRISFEYTMVDNVNDTKECALELAELLKGMLCHVNLIPLNESDENGMIKSNINRVYTFKSILEKKGINATIRRTLGEDIEAACGLLKSRAQKETEDLP